MSIIHMWINIYMKLNQIFENVVDFAQARAKRAQQTADDKKQHEVEQSYHKIVGHDEDETQTVKELAEFEEWMITAKKKGRVPGFETMDDAVTYLLADIEIPLKITREKAIKWFSSLTEEDRAKVRVLAH